MNRKWRALVVLLLAATSLWAKGTAEKDFQDAGRGNFSQTVDLTKLTPGQYNVLVRAKDAAGNVSYAGPFNFQYDPSSDNPLITIANPSPLMRVGGSMNFVGVSSAPKGSNQVEVKVDEGEWSPAQGKAFWSYRFDATPFKDGLHHVSVRGTDVNGVVGPISTAAFYLDQSAPVLTLTSIKSGDRVQGEIALEGTLADGNGLKTLEYSLDAQKTFQRMDLQGDGNAVSRSFKTMLDTRKLKDGPIVVWFHGVDDQGSGVTRAFLLYVDNTVPVITVLSPAADQGLHGKVRFVVWAEKLMGLKTLTAKVGDKGEPVTIPVVAGNPFHAVDLDLPEHGAGTVAVSFEAVDTSGKIGRVVYQAKLNGDSDLPELTLATILDKTSVTAPVRLAGTLKATDGPAGIAWSVNTGAETVEPVGAAFDFELKGLASGVNKLTLVGVDKNGKRGKPIVQTFTALLGGPLLEWTSASWSGQDVPFRPGLAIGPDRKARLTGKVTWPNPMKTLTWTLGDGKELPATATAPDKSGQAMFTLALPDDPPFGPVPVTVTATDTYGQTAKLKSFVDIANLSKPKDGLAFADARVGQAVVAVTADTPLRAVFTGSGVAKAEIVGSGDVSAFAVSTDGAITVQAKGDGLVHDAKLRVTDDRGRVWDADLGTLSADTAAPSLTLTSPRSGQWVGESVKLEGKAADANGITKLEWSTDGQNWQNLASGGDGSFSSAVTLPGPDDAVRLFVRATDGAGRTAWAQTAVRRDAAPPVVDLVFPEGVQGTYAVGRIRDEALKEAEITFLGMNIPLQLDKPFVVPVEGPEPLKFRLTDWAGNVTETSVAPADTPANAAKPTVQILFPPAGMAINGVIPVTGRIAGFTGTPVVAVQGASATPDLTAAGYFTVDIDVSALKNRTLTVTAAGENKQLATAALVIPADASPPKARVIAAKLPPDAPAGVGGWLGGRGALSYAWQLDGGGKTVVNADPAAPLGAFFVDVSSASPGAHKVTVTPSDASGPGAPVTADVVVAGPPGKAELSAELGAPLAIGKDTKLTGKLTGATWKKTEYRFADLSLPDGWSGPLLPLSVQKDGAFSLPVPSTLPFGRIGVVVRAEDNFGQVSETRTYFERVWSKSSPVEDADGLYFIDQRLDDQNRFQTSPGVPLVGTFRGRPLQSVTIAPPIEGVTVSNDNGVITVSAGEGVFGPFRVNAVTVDNEVFRSPEMTIVSDTAGPTVELTTPQNADWIKGVVTLRGTVTDASGLASLDVSFNGTDWSPVSVDADGTFDALAPATGPDGLTRVTLRAVDKGGHSTIVTRAITKDSSAPAFTVVAPPADRKINGLTTIAGTATDLNPIASIEYSDDGSTFQPADGTGVFAFDLNLQSYEQLPEHFFLRTTDAAGNSAITPIDLPIDQDTDKPTVQIQTPADGEVERGDFQVSGLAYDDDAVKSLWWRIDGGDWVQLDSESSFQIPIAIKDLTDNEHTVEVQAEDIYGTKGDIAQSTFKVSLAPPSAVLLTPQIETTVNGVVSLAGASFDHNGISSVQISLDNGLTWNHAVLRDTEELIPDSGLAEVDQFPVDQRKEWEWRFDSHTLKDGTYLVMVKTTDGFDTDGMLTTLVSVDNTAPQLTLSTPLDGERLLDSADLDGRTSDNINLVSLKAELRAESGASSAAGLPGIPIAVPSVGPVVLETDLPVTPTFHSKWNLGSLAPGWYNLRLEAKDKAGNTTFVARNVRIEGAAADRIDLYYPLAGSSLNNTFFVQGRVTSRVPVDKVTLTFDDQTKVEAAVSDQGYFSMSVDDTSLAVGDHTLVASSPSVASEPRSFHYEVLGPWVKVVSHSTGSYVTQRPFLEGIAGWKDEPLPTGATNQENDDYRRLLESHRVDTVDVSLDNGKTFAPAQGQEIWKFRIESLGLPDGPLPLLVRAKFRDGTSAYRRLVVTVLQTPPVIKLLTPVENGHFNLSLALAGYSEGDADAAIAIRQGDKGAYEVPSFIQGMYLDAHVWGATYYEAGLGFTFFQDAVKLQAQYGQAPPDGRFFGTVSGAKLIASVAQFPMGYFFGPDWNWLSTSFGLGANFSVFSMGPGVWNSNSVFLGGVVVQWEVAKATLHDLKAFKSYAWYLELTSWFISSDVQAEAKLTASTGIRIGLF